MKLFLKKLLFFLIWFLSISFILQQVIFIAMRSIRVGELGVINKVMKGEINTEIIICGASRSYDAFDTRVINEITKLSCYNISLTGSRLGLQLPVLKSYLEQNRPPKIIILEIGMYSLDFDSRVYSPYKYLPYLSNRTVYDGLLEVDRSFVFQRYLPFTSFYYLNTDFQKRFFKDLTYTYFYKKDYLIDGYNPMTKNSNFDQNYISDFVKNNYFIYAIDEKAKTYLKEVILLCQKSSIPLILVNTPEYQQIMPLYKNKDEIDRAIKKIIDEENIPYFDYNGSNFNYEKNYFYDFTHLNSEGAKKFSEDFAYDLVRFIDS